jgi:hypothetical protein
MPLPAPPRAVLAAAAALAVALPAVARGQAAPGDTGTTAAPIPPWERRSPARVAIGGAGLFQSARGAAGQRLQEGGGFDVFGSLAVSALALNVGYQRSAHRLPGAGAGRATDQGVFVEPRLSVAPLRNFTPYLAGRVAFLRRSGGGAFADERTSLVAYGGGAGTLVWVAPGVQLDLAAMYTRTDRGDGASGAFAGGTGGAALLRAGVVVGLDRWGR